MRDLIEKVFATFLIQTLVKKIPVFIHQVQFDFKCLVSEVNMFY